VCDFSVESVRIERLFSYLRRHLEPLSMPVPARNETWLWLAQLHFRSVQQAGIDAPRSVSLLNILKIFCVIVKLSSVSILFLFHVFSYVSIISPNNLSYCRYLLLSIFAPLPVLTHYIAVSNTVINDVTNWVMRRKFDTVSYFLVLLLRSPTWQKNNLIDMFSYDLTTTPWWLTVFAATM